MQGQGVCEGRACREDYGFGKKSNSRQEAYVWERYGDQGCPIILPHLPRCLRRTRRQKADPGRESSQSTRPPMPPASTLMLSTHLLARRQISISPRGTRPAAGVRAAAEADPSAPGRRQRVRATRAATVHQRECNRPFDVEGGGGGQWVSSRVQAESASHKGGHSAPAWVQYALCVGEKG